MPDARPTLIYDGDCGICKYWVRYWEGLTSGQALSGPRQQPWFVGFLHRLLENSPPVLALLASSPFPDGPPKYVRATLYDYRFADRTVRAATGQWWVRRREDEYFPAVGLADFARSRADR